MCPAQFLEFSQADFNESVRPHFHQHLCEYSYCPLTLRIRLRITNMQNTNNYKHADDFCTVSIEATSIAVIISHFFL